MKYKNIHTNKVVDVVDTQTVKSNPEDILVFILENGDRWEANLFYKHHIMAKAEE